MRQRETYDRHYARRSALQRELLDHPHLRDLFDRLADRSLATLGEPSPASSDAPPVRRILEIGCGEGLLGAALARRAAAASQTIAYTGSDISDAAVRIAGRAAPGTYVTGEAVEVAASLDDRSYDLVIVKNLLHHLPDATPFLREVARILTPSGRFVAAEASLGSPQAWFFNVLAPLRERYFFVSTRRRVHRHHTDAGLEVVSVEPFSWLPYELAFVIRPGLFRRLARGSDPDRVRRLASLDERLSRSAPWLAAYRLWVARRA